MDDANVLTRIGVVRFETRGSDDCVAYEPDYGFHALGRACACRVTIQTLKVYGVVAKVDHLQVKACVSYQLLYIGFVVYGGDEAATIGIEYKGVIFI